MKNHKLIAALLFLFSGSIQSQVLRWAESANGPGSAFSRNSVTTPQGMFYVMGMFTDSLVFGNTAAGVLVSKGGTDVYVAKYDNTGSLLWVKQFGGKGEDFGAKIHQDTNGDLFICGSFRDTVDFDPGAGSFELNAASQQHGFLLKLDEQGVFLWAGQFSGNNVTIADVTTDINGVFLTGDFSGSVDADPGSLVKTHVSNGWYDILIARLNKSLSLTWSHYMGGTGVDRGTNIAILNQQLFVSGNFQGRMDFDPGPGFNEWYSIGQTDMFVLKLDEDGFYLRHGFMGGSNSGLIEDLVLDDAGTPWLTGSYSGSLDFDPQSGQYISASVGGEDMFLLHLDNQLNFVKFGTIHGPANEAGFAIFINQQGKIFVTGHFEETSDLDPGDYEYNVASAGGADIFVLQLNRFGDFVCVRTIGGPGSDGGRGIGLDQNDNLYLSGSFAGQYSGNVDFDPGPGVYNLNSFHSSYDAFVASFNICTDVTGIDQFSETRLFAYPNPVENKVAFGDLDLPAHLVMYDGKGQIVLETDLGEQSADLGGLSEGLYHVRIETPNSVRSCKLMKN